MKNKLSPIVLFTYNRLHHTRKTVEALQKNTLAQKSQLFIYVDAPKKPSDKQKVIEVRKYLKTITGFKKITIIERDKNWGLANSIIDGVTNIVNQYGAVIVLEDDMVTSPYFLTYMNEALNKFEEDNRVASIHGYIYPIDLPVPEAFFLRGADCWGWATWKRAWDNFNPDGQFLLDELKKQKLVHAFDYNGTSSYAKMLKEQIKGNNDSWAIRWYASAFLENKLTLYPARTLIQNIGNDNSGTHCGNVDTYSGVLSSTPINISHVVVERSNLGQEAFEGFFKRNKHSFINRIYNRIKHLI